MRRMASADQDRDPLRNCHPLFRPPPESYVYSVPILSSLLTRFVHHLSQNAVSAFKHVAFRREVSSSKLRSPSRRHLVVTFVSSHKVNPSDEATPELPLPTASLLVNTSRPSTTETAASDAASAAAADGSVSASSTGPAFIGQVFTMCDASRRGLIAVRPLDPPKSRKIPFIPSFLSSAFEQLVDKGAASLKREDSGGPIFRFYFDKDDASSYVKKLGIAGSMVGSCPLDAAYKYFKGKPPMFRFMPDKKQVKVAKKLLREDLGKTAARTFSGVPVFTARNLTIAMSTPGGVRWFTPYFFDKQHLDKLIGHSVDHYYRMLIHARRSQRHSQIVDDISGDQGEDDMDGLMDPPEVQEFMEEMGQGGNSIMDSVLLKAAEVQFYDLVDNIILGNSLSRRLAGLQPSFPVLVDSFERRAAAAEADLSDGPRSSLASPQNLSKAEDKTQGTGAGRSDGGTPASGSDPGDNRFSDEKLQKEAQTDDEKLQAEGASDQLGSRCRETAMRKEEPIETMHPKLTMMGIAMTEPNSDMNDAVLQKAMAAAAKDIENRVRKGEGSGIEHGPLFIADLGGPQKYGEEIRHPFQAGIVTKTSDMAEGIWCTNKLPFELTTIYNRRGHRCAPSAPVLVELVYKPRIFPFIEVFAQRA